MRCIPIRLVPLPGESLDSWIVAYAARLQLSIGELAHALLLDYRWLRRPLREVALGGRDAQFASLDAASEASAIHLDALWRPLARYADGVHGRFGRADLARAARPMSWSRFCSACLGENAGRWAAMWRLPWCVTCARHDCFLGSICQRCGGRQRQRPLVWDLQGSQTTTCSLPRRGATGRGDHRCGQDLTAEVPSGPVPEQMQRLQHDLMGLLAPDIADEALTVGIGHLADLVGMAFLSGLSPTVSLGTTGMHDVTAIANALVDADSVLSDRNVTRLVELVETNTRPPGCPRVLPSAWAAAIPSLVARVLAVRDPVLAPTDRLRWRTTTEGTRPVTARAASAMLARCLPHALWLDWSVRLGSRTDSEASCFRTVTAAALLLPGSSALLSDLVAGLSDDPAAFARTTLMSCAPSPLARAALSCCEPSPSSATPWPATAAPSTMPADGRSPPRSSYSTGGRGIGSVRLSGS